MSKQVYPADRAMEVAKQLRDMLSPFCEPDRCKIVGSLRRQKIWVGDIEILYVPKFRLKAADLFKESASQMTNLADEMLDSMVNQEIIKPRPNKNGVTAWGEQNKLAVHVESGIPVDFFATTEDGWVNALVVRTGGKQNNIQICSAARKLGWTFEAYGTGFRSLRGLPYHPTTSEKDVYDFVKLPYLEPVNRP